MKKDIVSLNLADLDVEELESRLRVAAVSAEDGWGCDTDCGTNCGSCPNLTCCSNKPQE